MTRRASQSVQLVITMRTPSALGHTDSVRSECRKEPSAVKSVISTIPRCRDYGLHATMVRSWALRMLGFGVYRLDMTQHRRSNIPPPCTHGRGSSVTGARRRAQRDNSPSQRSIVAACSAAGYSPMLLAQSQEWASRFTRGSHELQIPSQLSFKAATFDIV